MASEQCEQFSVKKVFFMFLILRFGSVARNRTGEHVLKLLITIINVLPRGGVKKLVGAQKGAL